jgi:hypothetical protein
MMNVNESQLFYGGILAGQNFVAQAYARNMKRAEQSDTQSSEEKHDEEVKIKPILPTGSGNHVDLYA